MLRTTAAFCGALLLALALVACGDDGGEPSPTAPPSPTPAATEAATPAAPPSPAPTEAPPTPSPSTTTPTPSPTEAPDADAPDTVRRLLEDVAELRGLAPPPEAPVEIVPRRDLRALLELGVTEEDLREYAKVTTLYRLLGHLRPDEGIYEALLSASDSVLGFYDTEAKKLWVVSESETLDDLGYEERLTLVHELMHLLQDHHFDLGATAERVGSTLDAQLALSAVVEGDAEAFTYRYAWRASRRPSGGWLFLRLRAASLQSSGLTPTLLRELEFPYTEGFDWATATLARGGVEAINGFLREPPPATTLILHPDLLETDWTPEETPLPAIVGALGEGWELESEGVLGEFHLGNYLLALDEDWKEGPDPAIPDAQKDAAAGWAGDRYAVYVNGDESVVVARVRFVNAEEADEFAQTHRTLALAQAEPLAEGTITIAADPAQGTATALTAPVGRDVFFAIGTNADAARAALEALIGG